MSRDWTAYALLLAASIFARAPFLRAFDLVAYDGTYYIRQAESMLGASPSGGAFPVGYPALIAILLLVVHDGVRAAQLVSFAAGIGSVWILYALGKRLVSKPCAFLAALALAVTPLFVRLTLTTLSESAFIFWILLGFYMCDRRRILLFGLAMGMAAITRPEGLGVFVVLLAILAAKRIRPRALASGVLGFAVLFLVNAAVLSVTTGRPVLVPKAGFFGTTTVKWQAREAWVDFAGRGEYDKELETGAGANVLVDAAKRIPREIALLARHAMPVAVLLALYGVLRRRLFILAGFTAFLFYPFFTPRSDPRYILPYVPFVLLYASVGLDRISAGKWRAIASALFLMSTVAGLYANREQLFQPVSDGFQWAKKAGLAWRGRVREDDKVADRKPYFAFYAGAKYVEIPIAPYDDAVEHMRGENVKLLMLHRPTIEVMRPALGPLLGDAELIRGEFRLRQVEVVPGTYALYESTGEGDPLERKRITPPIDGILVSPSWSPDGTTIAYRLLERSGSGGVYLISPEGGATRCVVREQGTNDLLAWSPDSKRIAFANGSGGNMDIHVIDIASGRIVRVTSEPTNERSPVWSADGMEIVFSSNRSGVDEIWSKNLETDTYTQITSRSGCSYPALSPRGDRVAFRLNNGSLVVLERDTGQSRVIETPRRILYAPTWSPDGRFIAVSAEDSGGAQVYLLTDAGRGALMVTKWTAGSGMPSWSPDSRRIAIVSNEEGDYGLWILSGLEAYETRVISPITVETVGTRN